MIRAIQLAFGERYKLVYVPGASTAASIVPQSELGDDFSSGKAALSSGFSYV
jgi:hypothetical protein